MQFDWDQHQLHVEALRAMGCAVVTITTSDVQSLTDDENDEPTMNDEDARKWMELHSDDVEEAILGDYWGDTIRDLLTYRPLEKGA